MSSSIPRSSLSFAARCRQSTSYSSRNFSTTPSCHAIGPESPKFIEIPTTRQRDAVRHRDVKGTLPPPRNLFPNRGPNKVSEEYLSAVTREPSNKSVAPNDLVAWKRRMAASRRENLREGLIELNKRKVRQEAIVAQRSAKKRQENQARLHAPQREDERLMNPTITEAMSKPHVGFLPDPERESELAAKAMRVQEKEARREAQRKDALHTLYMNARSFITTQAELDAEIDKIFMPFPFPQNPDSTNIWEALSIPPTVQDMLSVVNGNQINVMEYHTPPSTINNNRLKRITEELTGGKMD